MCFFSKMHWTCAICGKIQIKTPQIVSRIDILNLFNISVNQNYVRVCKTHSRASTTASGKSNLSQSKISSSNTNRCENKLVCPHNIF